MRNKIFSTLVVLFILLFGYIVAKFGIQLLEPPVSVEAIYKNDFESFLQDLAAPGGPDKVKAENYMASNAAIAVPQLIARLRARKDDKKSDDLVHIVYALYAGGTASAAATNDLSDLLQNEDVDPNTAMLACWALRGMNDAGIVPLIKTLDSKSPAARKMALDALSPQQHSVSNAIPKVVGLLRNDGDIGVQLAAGNALGRLLTNREGLLVFESILHVKDLPPTAIVITLEHLKDYGSSGNSAAPTVAEYFTHKSREIRLLATNVFETITK